jgi:polyisoprenyl-teichoic acid--peptidoglycan teichoic acid transferase
MMEIESRSSPSSGAKVRKAVGFTLICVVALGVGIVGGYLRNSRVLGKAMYQSIRHIPPAEVFNQDQMNLLVLGCDIDYGPDGKPIESSKARSDMMMLARVDFANKKVSALSIARDIYYTIPGTAEGHRMNAFHKNGGDDLSKQAVESLLGVHIDRVITLNFEAFQELINTVGGVNLTVDKAMKYDDNAGNLHIDIKPGPQHMNGYQAMGFVRFRHADSDLMRQKRQQQFLLALEQQLKSNPGKVDDVAVIGEKVLGDQFDDNETAALANFAKDLDRTKIKFGQVPVLTKRGSTALAINEKKTPKILASLGFLGEQAEKQQELADRREALHHPTHH